MYTLTVYMNSILVDSMHSDGYHLSVPPLKAPKVQQKCGFQDFQDPGKKYNYFPLV